jgi:uncharacterized surface protein with fasciclin (FAS1) repeats
MADGIIGSVGVSVVPDAQDFWRRFEAQTRAGAAEAGRRAGNDWQRGFRAGAGDTDIRVRADTSQARAQIAALNKEGKQHSQGLLSALASLAPALVPLAAAAGLGGAALGSMGVQGVLAVKGIKTEIKSASAEGLKFSAGLNVLKGDLGTLEQTAAHNVLGAFQQATAKLHADLPAVNADLAQSSKVLGDIGGHLLGGIIGGEHTFAPALFAVEQQVDKLAASFEQWATGPGGEKFAATLAEDFQRVGPFIGNLVTALGHLIAASNGPGLAIVDELDTFASVLKAIPTPVLTTLVTGIVALRIAGTVSGLMNKLAVSIRGVAVAEGEATAATRLRGGLAGTVGVLGKLGATYLAVSLGAHELKNATEGWMYSLDSSKQLIGETSNALGDLFTGHIGSFVKDLTSGHRAVQQAVEDNAALADSYHSIVPSSSPFKALYQQTNALNEKQIDFTQTLIQGHAVYGQYTGAQALANEQAKELAANESSLAAILAQVHGKIGGGAGISQLAGQYTQAEGALQGNIDATTKFLKLGGEQVDTYHGVTIGLKTYQAALEQTGSATEAVGYIRAQIDALGNNKAALAALSVEQQNVSTYISDATTKYHLTTEQVDAYTAALGINASAIEAGGASAKTAEGELGRFVKQLQNGTTATDEWIAAVTQFQQGADTAASRATLMGAAFKAANGDTLGYANTLVQAATANQQLVTDFKNLKAGVLDLKTGTIDYHNAAAAPLLNDLQNLQTAAMNAASATYQHELATRGAKRAADDAFAVYRNDTRGALIDEATHLGLTSAQAKNLADQYFGIKNSGDLKKKIELLGGDQVEGFLRDILADLDVLAGKHVTASVSVEKTITTRKSDGSGGVKYQAAGGFISGPGSGTSDSIPAWLSNGEFVVNAKQTAKHRDMLHALNSGVQGFAGGGEPGGFSGVNYGGSGSGSGGSGSGGSGSGSGAAPVYSVNGQKYASLRAAMNAAARIFHAQVSLGVKIDGTDMTKFRAALKGTADQAHTAFLTMYNDARKLGISDGLAGALRKENTRLDKEINARNKAAAKLKDVTDKFNQVRDSVSQAAKGSFDITTAGTGFDGQQPITFGNIQAQETQAKNLVAKWAAGIRKLLPTFGKSATGKAMIADLAQRGPSDYPEVQALLTASPKDLTDLISTQYQINKTGTDLGTSVGNTLYGKQIGDLKAEIKLDDKSINKLADRMEHQLSRAVDKIANRPIIVKVDSTQVARAGAAGTKKNARRT